MPRREGFNRKAKSQRRVSPVIRELLASTDPSLGSGGLTADFIECGINL